MIDIILNGAICDPDRAKEGWCERKGYFYKDPTLEQFVSWVRTEKKDKAVTIFKAGSLTVYADVAYGRIYHVSKSYNDVKKKKIKLRRYSYSDCINKEVYTVHVVK